MLETSNIRFGFSLAAALLVTMAFSNHALAGERVSSTAFCSKIQTLRSTAMEVVSATDADSANRMLRDQLLDGKIPDYLQVRPADENRSLRRYARRTVLPTALILDQALGFNHSQVSIIDRIDELRLLPHAQVGLHVIVLVAALSEVDLLNEFRMDALIQSAQQLQISISFVIPPHAGRGLSAESAFMNIQKLEKISQATDGAAITINGDLIGCFLGE